jgi:hypothetical protein
MAALQATGFMPAPRVHDHINTGEPRFSSLFIFIIIITLIFIFIRLWLSSSSSLPWGQEVGGSTSCIGDHLGLVGEYLLHEGLPHGLHKFTHKASSLLQAHTCAATVC